MTFTAEFTQYLRPHGQQKPITTDLPDDCKEAYDALISAGMKLEIEVLQTGEVSATVHNPSIGEDVDIIVHKNGPGLQENIAEMINRRLWEESHG
jgi:hypothetical protein